MSERFPSNSESIPKPPEKAVLVDVADVAETEARDAAEKRMTESAESLRGVRGMVRRVWKHNLFHEYYRQKEIARAREEMADKEDIYGAETTDRRAHNEAMKAIIDRFASEYDEAIHEGAGEEREVLEETPSGEDTREMVRSLIESYAEGDLDDDSFEEEKNRVFSEIRGIDPDTIQKGVTYADNLKEIAESARQAIAHGQGIEELDLDFDLVIGRAKSSIYTEAKFNTVDRIVDKMQRSTIGKFANETTIASAVAIAYGIGKAASLRATRSRVAAWSTFGGTAVIAGAVAGARESRRIEDERRQHARERARGAEFDESAKRREEMETFRYETVRSDTIADELESALYTYNEEEGQREVREDVTEEDALRLMDTLGDAEARIILGEREKLDLIHYGSLISVEKERLRLDVVRARTKVDIRKLTERRPDLLGRDADEMLQDIVEAKINELTRGSEGIEERDRLFKKMKRAKVAKAVVKGVAVGVAIGGTAQEVGAFFMENTEGAAEGVIGMLNEREERVHGELQLTPLEKARQYLTGDVVRARFRDMEIIKMGSEGTVQLPEGCVLQPAEGERTFSLLQNGKVLAEHVSFEEDGGLTEEARAMLEENDIRTTEDVVSISETKQETIGARSFIEEHPENFMDVHRALWYDNDTPAPVFDKNELRLWWGGVGGKGVDAEGNFVFSIKQMTADGSTHGKFSADAGKLAAEGKLKLILSLSRDTQGKVMEVPIGADGIAAINPTSEVGKMLFAEGEGGAAKFLGKYVEVAEVVGDAEGKENVHVLATHVGEGIKDIDTVIETSRQEITTLFDVPADTTIEPPPVIPLLGRAPLERMRKTRTDMPYYLYDRAAPEDFKKEFEARRSKTLKENPNAKLDHYSEIRNYLNALPGAYRKTIKELGEQMGGMSAENRLTICIPAAGHQEGKSIYQSLENFVGQTSDPSQYEIVVFVNHPDEDKEGNPIAPDETIDEIKRFQRQNPEFPIRYAYSVIPVEQANIGHVRKLLNDAVLLRQHERGKDAPDLIMVSNDADNKGIAPEYIKNFIEKFEEEPEKDGLLGQLDWDPEAYTKFPAIHVGTRLFQYLNIIGRRRSGGLATSGANFAFRSSIYAGIGGYMADLPGAEDVRLGQAIVEARGKKASLGFAGARASRVYTSARRSIDAWRKGLAPLEQWEGGFSAFDDEVRKMIMPEGDEIDYDDPAAQKRLKEGLEYAINRTLNQYIGEDYEDKNAPNFRKALGWLGITYELDEKGEVAITNISKLAAKLKNYQDYAVLQRDMKSGRPGAEKGFRKARGVEKEKPAERSSALERLARTPLDLTLQETLTTPEEITSSREQERVGSYIVAKDKVIKENNYSRVAVGIRHDDEKSTVVLKETTEKDAEEVETYLARRSLQNHPNLALPKEQFEHEGKKVRVYEAGMTDLDKVLKEKKLLPPKQAIRIIAHIAAGVGAMHQVGVVHRDVAPLNIILWKDGAKLGDFDGSTIKRGDGFERSKEKGNFGNRFITPPELFHARATFNETVDIYELGATLFRMVAGKWPYNIEKKAKKKKWDFEERQSKYKNLHEEGNIEFPEQVPENLRPIIKRAMDPDPDNRYQSAEEFAADLEDAYKSL